MKRVDIDPLTKLLIVKFRFLKRDWEEEQETRRNIISLNRKTYSKGLGIWFVPPDFENIQKLWDWGFAFPPDFAEVVGGKSKIEKVQKPPYDKIKIPAYLDFLRPYQKEAIQFLKWVKGRGLIGDDMGVGKTIEALGWIKWTISKGPALIIVPSSTKPQWKREYKKFVGDNIEILYGKTPITLTRRSYIINWEMLQYWEKELAKVSFATIVADESQYAGNMKAKRTKVLRRLARHVPYFLPMSGTPITSKPKQFFAILNLLDPMVFPSEWKFMNRYCGPKHNGFSMTYDGVSHSAELHRKISKLMIRRKKRDVLKDLPPLTKSIVPMEIGKNAKKYKKLEQHFFETYGPHDCGTVEMDNEFYSLKMEVFDMKLPSILTWINEFIESDRKLLVGVWHHYVIDTLSEKYKDISVKINGSVTGKKREAALEAFYADKQILFLQMKSGGVGLDGLQKVCSDVAFVELGDTPTIMDQFESRLERSGQENPMNSSYLVGEGTVEQELMEALDEKRENITAVMEGRKAKDVDLLTMLYERRKK